jgi:peptide/nickel transport system permease protein
MYAYMVRRILQSFVVVFLVSTIVFAAIHLVPGDPVMAMLGSQANVTPDLIETLRQKWGVDRPVHEQYLKWISGLVRGDFGFSFFNQVPVTELIARKLPATIELAIASLAVSLLIGVLAGILAAVYENTIIDYAVTTFITLAMSLPGFWVAIVLIYLVSVNLRWLPSGGYVPFVEDPVENLRLLILPAGTLGILIAAPIMRFLRSSLLEELRQDYMRTARSKGLPERVVVYRHALKNAMIPTVTMIGLQLSFLLGGVVIIEYVFEWPGIGWQLVGAIFYRDYFVLQATVLLVAVFVVFVNLAVDMTYGALDPRIRYE